MTKKIVDLTDEQLAQLTDDPLTAIVDEELKKEADYVNPRFLLQTLAPIKGAKWRTVHTFKNKHRAQKAYAKDATERKRGGVRVLAPDGEEVSKLQIGA